MYVYTQVSQTYSITEFLFHIITLRIAHTGRSENTLGNLNWVRIPTFSMGQQALGCWLAVQPQSSSRRARLAVSSLERPKQRKHPGYTASSNKSSSTWDWCCKLGTVKRRCGADAIVCTVKLAGLFYKSIKKSEPSCLYMTRGLGKALWWELLEFRNHHFFLLPEEERMPSGQNLNGLLHRAGVDSVQFALNVVSQ